MDTSEENDEPEPEKPEASDGNIRVDGTVTDVQCKVQAMQIIVVAQEGPVKLHSSDYMNIEFISDVPIKSEEFYPCTSLKGHNVGVTYVPAPANLNQAFRGEIKRLVIHK